MSRGMRTIRVVALATLAACGSAAPPATAADAGACAPGETANVMLVTEDGLTLQGDFYATGAVGGPGAVLLHMIPPQWNRTSYPRAFIDELVASGISVLNLDRRGAGGSAGVAVDAYLGPNGKLDVEAAVGYLAAHACAIDP